MARRRKTGFVFLIIILLVLIGAGGGYYIYSQNLAEPVTITQAIDLTIESGSGTAAISSQLYEAGLTRSANSFRSYARQAGIDSQLRAGNYLFEPGEWTLEGIGQLLLAGTTSSETDIRVTIPEGLTVAATAAIFAEQGFCTVEEFLNYAEFGDFPYPYLPTAEEVIEPGNRLEGYLAPDTYMIDPSWGAEEIIDMLLAQFAKVWNADYQARADELEMSVQEVVTLASVIEKEAAVAVDRPIISGVFHKRLEREMLLQSCATIQFLLGEPKVPLLNSDLEIESPYNTYIYAGLPPAPIASPGKASLEAALWPEESDYLYFRARTDGSHRFSVTYQEHITKQPDDQ